MKIVSTVQVGALATLVASALASNGAERTRPPDRVAMVELGRRLFFDPTASADGATACAACHDPDHGFSDPRRFSQDANGPTRRHSQPTVDLPPSGGFHWDGEFLNLRELVFARVAPPQEATAQARALHEARFRASRDSGRNPEEAEFQRSLQRLTPPYYGPVTPGPAPTLRFAPVETRLAQDERYDHAFARAFGSPDVTTARIADALEAYLLSIRSAENPYDRFAAGDPDALSPEARRGLDLFLGKANCASCHSVGSGRATFTDGKFHNTGVAARNVGLEFSGSVRVDGGHALMSFVAADLGAFKTPSLRDVARRPPYMHDGSFATLEDVVRYYDVGGTPNERLDPRIRPLRLTDAEVRDLVAFLESLTGDERPGLFDARGPRRARLHLVDLRGRPLAGAEIEIHPFGDRSRGARSGARPLRARTDAHGWLDVEFPDSTHAILRSATHEIAMDRPIPDTIERATLVASRKDEVAVMVVGARRPYPESIVVTPLDLGRENGALARRLRRVGSDGSAVFYAASVETPLGERNAVVRAGAKRTTTHPVDLSGGLSGPIHFGE